MVLPQFGFSGILATSIKSKITFIIWSGPAGTPMLRQLRVVEDHVICLETGSDWSPPLTRSRDALELAARGVAGAANTVIR